MKRKGKRNEKYYVYIMYLIFINYINFYTIKILPEKKMIFTIIENLKAEKFVKSKIVTGISQNAQSLQIIQKKKVKFMLRCDLVRPAV